MIVAREKNTTGRTKVDILREFLPQHPQASYRDAVGHFKKLGLTVTEAQFYTARQELRLHKKRQAKASRQVSQPAGRQLAAAKSGIGVSTDLASRITQEHQVELGAVLEARKILSEACQSALAKVGTSEAVGELLDDVRHDCPIV